MKMKYVWLNQNRTESIQSRYFQNSSKAIKDTSMIKNIRENHQHSRPIKKIKRFRSAYTTYQINYLETEFRKFPYVGTTQRKEVSAALKIPERAVKIWFQNRRMKEKKEINLRETDNGKTGEKIHESIEQELHIPDSVQPTIRTQIDTLPFIVNNVDDSNNINCNTQNLRQDVKMKVTTARVNNRIKASKVIVTPALTLCKKNQNQKVPSAQFLFNSGKNSNNNINEDNAKQNQGRLKQREFLSINRFIKNNGHGIQADISIRKQKVSARKYQMDNCGEDKRQQQQTNNSLTKKNKRFRSAFTTEQTRRLEREFRKIQYIGNTQRKEIADALNIPESAVKIWFQNRRMKDKKECYINEYEQHTNRKILEFPKGQLTAINDVQLTNEEVSCCMPLQETFVKNVINSSGDSKIKNQEINILNIKETVKTNSEVYFSKIQTNDALLIENGNLPLNYNKGFINLCKDKKKIDIKQHDQPLLNDLHPKFHQDMPQDLSVKKQKSSQTQSAEPKLTHLISNVCPNTYIPHGSILWKPINIIPVASTGSSVSVPVNNSSNLLIADEQYFRNMKCNCDCHVKMVSVPMVLQRNSENPQFILTTLSLDKQL